MKIIPIDNPDLNSCLAEAQSERVILTRNGPPVALLTSIAGLDREQIELGTSAKFWNLMRTRRKEKTMSRAELEATIQRKVNPKRKGS